MAKFPARLPRARLEKPRSRQPSQPALSYEHVEILLKGSRDVPRSRKPGQPDQPGSYEEALGLKMVKGTVINFDFFQRGRPAVADHFNPVKLLLIFGSVFY